MSDLMHAPPSFVNCDGQQIVFVDFTQARYRLEFDAAAAEATVHSEIEFSVETPGLAAICMNQPILAASLDGHAVTLNDQDSPDKKASFKAVSKPVTAGGHKLTIESRITKPGPYGFPITWWPEPARLECTFNMSDLQCDGGYLEAFLPSNYCFDHFRMSFSVTVKNSHRPHSVFSNGTVSSSSNESWTIEFPCYYNSSCPWLHLGPADEYECEEDTFSSKYDRNIRILVYTKLEWKQAGVRLDRFIEKIKCTLSNLESDFGPYPHNSVTVFALRECGISMEYAGAAATTLRDVRHELAHSYFGRSIMPVNGDAGWIDEAIATWWAAGDSVSASTPYRGINMAARSKYLRTTSRAAYTIGKDFMVRLDNALRARGGLKEFLRECAERKRYQSITATEFQCLVERFQGASLQRLFEEYVYGQGPDR